MEKFSLRAVPIRCIMAVSTAAGAAEEQSMEQKAVQFVNTLLGKKPLRVCGETEIPDFGFAPPTLHAMGSTRVIKNNDILVTTPDYQSWGQVESTRNDEWFNLKRYRPEIAGGSAVSVKISPWHDPRIGLDNGVTIKCLTSNAYPHYAEGLEQWVLFEPPDNHGGVF